MDSGCSGSGAGADRGERAERLRLLAWMRAQDFERIRPGLLPEVERLVVAEHAALRRDLLGEAWSPPRAYRWIRYEHPDPVGQLIDATRRLDREWRAAAAHPGAAAVRERFEEAARVGLDRALRMARELGYPKR